MQFSLALDQRLKYLILIKFLDLFSLISPLKMFLLSCSNFSLWIDLHIKWKIFLLFCIYHKNQSKFFSLVIFLLELDELFMQNYKSENLFIIKQEGKSGCGRRRRRMNISNLPFVQLLAGLFIRTEARERERDSFSLELVANFLLSRNESVLQLICYAWEGILWE